MPEVIGPISAEDWETMVYLRRSLKAMQDAKDEKYQRQIRREKNWYNVIFNRCLEKQAA